jgi:glycosyltransferase involved in cell wall biosynthesis
MARLALRLAQDGWPILMVTGPGGARDARFDRAGIRLLEVGASGLLSSASSESGPRAEPAKPAPGPEPGQSPATADRPAPLWRRAAREMAFLPDPQIWWIQAARRAVLAALQGRVPLAIVASAPPFSMFLLAKALARKTGAPLVLDYRDVWTTHPWWPIPAWRRPIERALERSVQRRAALVIANHEPMRAQLAAGRPWLDRKTLVLPNGFNPEEWGPPVRPAFRPGPRFEIAYAGTFYAATRHDRDRKEPLSVRRPVGLLQALRRLRDEEAFGPGGVRLRFIGARPGTPDAELVLACAAECGVASEVEVLPRRPRADLVPLLRASHLLVNFVYHTEAQVTQKLYEYMHLQIPVLSLIRESPPNAALAERAGCGPIVDPGDPDAIAGAIRSVLRGYVEGTPIRPDRAFIDQFDVRRQAALLADRLRSLGAGPIPAGS